LGGFYSGDVNHSAWPSETWVCREMDKRFTVESKAFAFSALDGASVLGVMEKRKRKFRRGLHEYLVLRVACVDVGSAVGCTK
jgi:hypothetical protein